MKYYSDTYIMFRSYIWYFIITSHCKYLKGLLSVNGVVVKCADASGGNAVNNELAHNI
jgi:hypothetical protein